MPRKQSKSYTFDPVTHKDLAKWANSQGMPVATFLRHLTIKHKKGEI